MAGPPGTEHMTDEEFLAEMKAHGHRWGKSSFLPLNMMAPVCMNCMASLDSTWAFKPCDRPVAPDTAETETDR